MLISIDVFDLKEQLEMFESSIKNPQTNSFFRTFGLIKQVYYTQKTCRTTSKYKKILFDC